MTDTQTQLRELVDQYLDTHLIRKVNIEAELQDTTTVDDKHITYLPTGKITVTIELAKA